MAASQEFSKEQLNYYRICYVTTDILTEGLRSLFKQEWDNRYKATLGEWKDDPKSGRDFYNGESPRNQRRNADLLVTIRNGDRAKWDCTMLFYAILYSDCIGSSLSPAVKTNVDDLRKFRNEEFAHMPRVSPWSMQTFKMPLVKSMEHFKLSAFLLRKLMTSRIRRIFPRRS